MDLHQNLFYSYRGPHTDSCDRERQLENNVTKALINTLQLGGEAVWRPFLAEVGISESRDVEFLLQRRDLASGRAANKRHRVLLGISSVASQWSPEKNAGHSRESVPDAWIHGDGFAVLLESKVFGDFSEDQMQAHLARLKCEGCLQPKVFLMTWRDLHRFFQGLQSRLTGLPAVFVQQFAQFLEYSGVSGFTGFRRDHFDYFVSHDDDDARQWVREQMKDLAEQVQKRLGRYDSSFYEDYDIGTLKLSHPQCWAAFGPREKAYRKVTHQTIALQANGLRVFVNAELKSTADRIKAVLRQSTHSIREALRSLHEFKPFDLVLEERTQRQASMYDDTPKIRLHSSLLADDAVGGMAWMVFTETYERLRLPYLRVERLVPPATLLRGSANAESEGVELVIEILKQNHTVVKLLNG